MSHLAELPARHGPHRVRKSEPLPPALARPELIEMRGAVLDRLRELSTDVGEQSVTAETMHDHDQSVPVETWAQVLVGMLAVGGPPSYRRLLYLVPDRLPHAYALAPFGHWEASRR